MAGKMDGRRVIVTGAASGMGERIAEVFAAEGAALTLFDLNAPKLSAVAGRIGAAAQVCDVADADSVAAAVTAAVRALGGLDGVVNAAGVHIAKPFPELDPASWRRMIDVNLTGPYNVLRSALAALQAAPSATIVNVASVSAYLPTPGIAGYGATKAGLLMFTKAIALDLGPNIRANAICPGVIRTEMTRHIWENPARAAGAADRVALKRLGGPDDVAKAALFLSTEDSAFTTGESIAVDGGFAWP
jgi:NAD(P)-dependent dehydrogenase (short-subunit alcohol dehydrogenase family)